MDVSECLPVKPSGGMEAERVLVLCATGKMGKGVARGLKDSGLDVYGTTRSAKSGGALTKYGIKPIVANYIVRADVDRAIKESGCKVLVFLTDYFLAAKSSVAREAEQGKMVVDAAKAAGLEFVVFLSVGDADVFDPATNAKNKVLHFHAKLVVERHLKASGLPHTIMRPVAFFENFDDAGNYNPLKKGQLKFLTEAPTILVSTYDVGKAAAVAIKNKAEWNGRTLECGSWKGSLAEAGAALSKVSGVPVKASLAMPLCARSLFLSDLHHMCLYFENGYQGSKVDIGAFKAVVPDAMDAEAWFRHHEVYANGQKIAK